jgi:uncharacterized membrane protein YbaN (DUF454 family)
MKLLLALLVILLLAIPSIVFIVVPYWHYRSHLRFKQWMKRAGITEEMLELAEKSSATDIQQ